MLRVTFVAYQNKQDVVILPTGTKSDWELDLACESGKPFGQFEGFWHLAKDETTHEDDCSSHAWDDPVPEGMVLCIANDHEFYTVLSVEEV